MSETNVLPLPEHQRDALRGFVDRAGLAAMVRSLGVSRESLKGALAGLGMQPKTRNRVLVGLARMRREPPPTKRPEYVTAPVEVFLRERCVVEPAAQVALSDLFRAWETWCKSTGRRPSTPSMLGRLLRDVVPVVAVERPRTPTSRVRMRVYVGVGLKP